MWGLVGNIEDRFSQNEAQIVKLGFRQGNTPFSSFFYFLLKIDYGCTHNLFLSQEKQQQNDYNFHIKIVIYTVVKNLD